MQLNDRTVDLVGEGYDVGVRIGTLPDSSMIAHRIALMEMRVCGSPSYLARRGTPQTPNHLREHECLPYGPAQNVSWNFTQHGKPRATRDRDDVVEGQREAVRADRGGRRNM